jgi:hypothetical protein
MSESKKHHYVPQVMLRKFGFNNKQIYVFDKTNLKSFPSSIVDAGSENNFNTLEYHGEKINFESVFQNVDTDFSGIQNILLNEGGTNVLGDKDRALLLEILVVQLVRTKIHRATIASIANKTNQVITKLYGDGFEYPVPNENDVRKIAFSSLQDIPELVSALSGKIGFLIKANDTERFIISDNPVVLNNSFPYGDRGLSSLGIEIYLPLSTEIALALYCPSVFRKMKAAVHSSSDMDDENRNIFRSVIDDFSNGVPVSLGQHTTMFLNNLQLSQSSRFLYGMDDSDFKPFVQKLQVHPELSQVESKISFGEVGKVPYSGSMPAGNWIVYHTDDDHFMFSVEYDSNDIGFSVTAAKCLEVEILLAFEVIKQVSLFRDKNESRHMKDVKVTCTNISDSDVKLTFQHTSEILNKIVSQVENT